MELNLQRIEDAVVEDAVERLISEDRLSERVSKAVDARLDALFAERLNIIIQERIDAAVNAGFEHEYTKRNSFGTADGPPTTIAKQLDGLIKNYWTQNVDRSGKPTESTYNAITRAEWTMTQICGAKFSEQMQSAMVTATAQLKDGLRAELRTSVDKMLGDLFRVRTNQDKAEGRYA